jgi:hypothetical protein
MVRDFQYNPSPSQIIDVLIRFDFVFEPEKSPLDVLRFEVMSPDSFMWKLLLGNNVYYLYAEDYIPGIDHVKAVFDEHGGYEKWEFITPRSKLVFERSDPVQHAAIYQKPEDAADIMHYAVDSGYDFVFLVKSSEDPDAAHFAK